MTGPTRFMALCLAMFLRDRLKRWLPSGKTQHSLLFSKLGPHDRSTCRAHSSATCHNLGPIEIHTLMPTRCRQEFSIYLLSPPSISLVRSESNPYPQFAYSLFWPLVGNLPLQTNANQYPQSVNHWGLGFEQASFGTDYFPFAETLSGRKCNADIYNISIRTNIIH